MKRAHYNALDALWMMKRHGMTFELGFDFQFHSGGLLHYAYPKFDTLLGMRKEAAADGDTGERCKFYPDAAGLALLTPKISDLVQVYFGAHNHARHLEEGIINMGVVVGVLGEGVFVRYAKSKEEDALYSPALLLIMERDGKPFIMPQWEE